MQTTLSLSLYHNFLLIVLAVLDRLSYIEQRSVRYSSVVQYNAHDTTLLFRSIYKLQKRQTEKWQKHYPSTDNDQQLAYAFADFSLLR